MLLPRRCRLWRYPAGAEGSPAGADGSPPLAHSGPELGPKWGFPGVTATPVRCSALEETPASGVGPAPKFPKSWEKTKLSLPPVFRTQRLLLTPSAFKKD